MHPIIVRRLLLPLHERLLGRRTLSDLRGLERSQWWPAARLEEFQKSKLRRLLDHAARRIPFYRDTLSATGIDPNTATLADLPRLPMIDKSTIRGNMERLCDSEIPGGLHRSTTGGSTGEPLTFYMDRTRQAADQAARARTRRWFNVDLGERELYLWGSPVEWTQRDRLKRCRDWLSNHYLLSAFRMTPRSMSAYIRRIHQFDPVHIFSYPSSLAQLVRHARAVGAPIRNKSLRTVFVTGELFDLGDRAIIEEAFAVPVADGYGSREGGFVAHQCPHGSYHITMEQMIVELVDEQGRAVPNDEAGEIVLTHLDSLGMPLIRYRTGDLAELGRVCRCGRALRTLRSIVGRRTDLLRMADGGTAHALSAIYILREEPKVAKFKIVQRPDLSLEVQVNCRSSFDSTDRERITRRLQARIGRVGVQIMELDEIPLDRSGKHRYVQCLAT
jgi:phenylacetate-CoA ligase